MTKITVTMNINDLETYAQKGMVLIYSTHLPHDVYWLETPSSEDDIIIGGASDFYDQNGIDFDENGNYISPPPAFDAELTATFDLDNLTGGNAE